MAKLFFKLEINNEPVFTKEENKYTIDINKINKSTKLLESFIRKKKLLDKTSFFYKISKLDKKIDDTDYLMNIFSIDLNSPDSGLIRATYEKDELKYYLINSTEKCAFPKCDKKYKFIFQNMLSPEMYNKLKEYDYCKIQSILFDEYYYKILYYLFSDAVILFFNCCISW